MTNWENAMRSAFFVAALSGFAVTTPASAQFAGPDYNSGPFNPAAGCASGCSQDPGTPTNLGAAGRVSPEYYTLRRIKAGERALNARNYDRAVHYFSLALEDMPEDAGVQYLAGASHYLNGDAAQAQEQLSSALSDDSSLDETRRKLAERMLADLASR